MKDGISFESVHMPLSSLAGKVANVSFLLLFPGYFFYQSALAIGYIPAFLSGYFSYVALALFFPLSIGFIYGLTKRHIVFGISDIIFIFILYLILWVSLFNYSFGPLAVHKELLVWSLKYLFLNIVCYMLALQLNLQDKNFRVSIFLSFIAMVAIVFFYKEEGVFYLKLLSEDNENVANYQGFGTALAVTGLVLIAISDEKPTKFMLAIVCSIALFFNSARSEFFLFITSVATSAIINNKGMIKKFSLIIIFVLSLLLFYFSSGLIKYFPLNRNFDLLNIEHSTSIQHRIYLTEVALQTIAENPFRGDYGSYVFRAGGIGCYSHNILSAWVDLGLVGILAYVLLIVMMVKISISKARILYSKEVELSLLFTLFVLGAFIFSKVYTYILFGFAIGILNLTFPRKSNPLWDRK